MQQSTNRNGRVLDEVMKGDYPDRLVVMTSGGIDSTTATYLLRRRCQKLRGIAINYGQLDFDRARQCINRMSVDLDLPVEVVDIRNLSQTFAGFIEKDYDGYPMLLTELSRVSAQMTTISSVYAEKIGYRGIVDAVNKDDLQRYTWRTKVHELVAATQSLGNPFQFRVVTPLIGLTRAEVLQLAAKIGVPLELTWSCWAGTILHCGRCPGCETRKERFRIAGMEDPVRYQDAFEPAIPVLTR